MKIAARLLFWWAIGIWATIASSDGTRGVNARDLALGAFIGVIAGLLFWAVNRYRTERALTWPQLAGRAVLLLAALSVLGSLARLDKTAWAHVTPALLVIGAYAAYVGAGLVVLYLAVRVIRAAWKR